MQTVSRLNWYRVATRVKMQGEIVDPYGSLSFAINIGNYGRSSDARLRNFPQKAASHIRFISMAYNFFIIRLYIFYKTSMYLLPKSILSLEKKDERRFT